MLATKRSADIATGVVLAAVGITAGVASTGIGEGAGGQLHPRTFPMILGTLLVIGGAWLAIRAMRSNAGGQAVAWPERAGWKRLLIALAGLILYVAVSQVAGFIISSLVFVPWFIRFFGGYSHRVAWSCAVGIAAFIYFVFVQLLHLTLPIGPLSLLLD